MIRVERKSEVDTNPIINKILENPSESQKNKKSYGQNQDNSHNINNLVQHFRPTFLRYYNCKQMELLRIIFCIVLGSSYVFLIASYPKLNFAINISNIFLGNGFSIIALILAISLMLALAFLTDFVFTILDLSSVLSEGYWTAAFFMFFTNMVLFFLSCFSG